MMGCVINSYTALREGTTTRSMVATALRRAAVERDSQAGRISSASPPVLPPRDHPQRGGSASSSSPPSTPPPPLPPWGGAGEHTEEGGGGASMPSSSGLATPDTSATEVNELAAARDAILESEAQPSASVVLGGFSLCAVVGGAFRWRKALANAFIRPPKTEYDAANDLGAARSIVGTHAVHPGARERVVTRVDFVLPGTAGLLQVISVVHGLNTTSCTIVKICSTAGCCSIVYKTHVSYNIGYITVALTCTRSRISLTRPTLRLTGMCVYATWMVLRMQCSLWAPVLENTREDAPLPSDQPRALPCVLYLHGNVGSRLEAFEVLDILLSGPQPCCLCAFDFGSAGLSEGESLSLGLWESVDVGRVLAHLASEAVPEVDGDRLALWGRSMGAVSVRALVATIRTGTLVAAFGTSHDQPTKQHVRRQTMTTTMTTMTTATVMRMMRARIFCAPKLCTNANSLPCALLLGDGRG